MAKKTNIEKAAEALGGKIEKFSDGSAQWITFENKDYSVCLSFDGKGKEFKSIEISKKKWAVISEDIVSVIKPK